MKEGLYEYLVMPIGLCTAPACFQRRMVQLLKPLIEEGFVEVYIDDILIYSESSEQHEEHLRQVLSILRENGLFCNLKKCQLFITQVTFISLIITPEGVSMDQDKVK